AEATRLRAAFRAPQMHQPPLVEEAMGRQALALLRQLDAACASADDLEQAAIESFNQHPDAEIITSFPGLGPLTGARVLAATGAGRPATATPPLSATSSRAYSAVSTTAWPPASATTKPSPSPTPPPRHTPPQLDNLTASDVWTPPALRRLHGSYQKRDQRQD